MKKFFWSFLFILNFAFWNVKCASATDVSGIVSTDTTWTLADSPYIVKGNTLVDAGVTLIIDPGVTVRFSTGTYLMVDGSLQAEGTEANYIIFTCNKDTPAPGDWQYIKFRDSSADADSIIKYCKIKYAWTTISCDHASPEISNNAISNNHYYGIYCSDSSPSISNNTISNNSYGIWSGGNSSPSISNNTISNNSYGIDCWGGSPSISKNIISNNGGWGISCCCDSSPSISSNMLTGNGNGLCIWDEANPTITKNNLYDNTSYNVQNKASNDTTVTNNWWGTTDTGEIEAKIFDYYDDFNYGKVIYMPFATEPFFAPSKITGLSASPGPGEGEVNLSWSAPGNDATGGTASYYSIRYLTTEITEGNWDTASIWKDSRPVSGPYSTPENETITGLTAGTTYYFRIKTIGSMEVWSALSNEATAWARIIPPPEKPKPEKICCSCEGQLEGEAGSVEPLSIVYVYAMDLEKYPDVEPIAAVVSDEEGKFTVNAGIYYKDLWIVSKNKAGKQSPSLHVVNPAAIPTETKLLPVRPNPFMPGHAPGEVILPYELKEDVDEVTIKIFTVGGELVKTLENMPNTAGKYLTGYEGNVWDGTNEDADEVPADVYCVFMTIKTAAFKEETIGPQFILLDRFPFLNYEEGQTLHRQSEFLSPGLYEVPITSWDITVPPDGVVYLVITRPNLDNVIVYPNPYKPGSGGSHDAPHITFANLTSQAKIKIFTAAAELVTEFKNKGGDSIATWDGTNDSGKKVASGIYIYVVTNDKGQHTVGKFVIIR